MKISSNFLFLSFLCLAILPSTMVYIYGPPAIVISFSAFIIIFLRYKVNFLAKDFYDLLIILLVFLVFSMFSLVNGGDALINTLKILHMFTFLFLIMVFYPQFQVSFNKLASVFFIFSVLLFFSLSYYRLFAGIPRFYGYSFDPNYLCFASLAIYIPTYIIGGNYSNANVRVARFLLRLTILSSLSTTGILMLLSFHILLSLQRYLFKFYFTYIIFLFFWGIYILNILFLEIIGNVTTLQNENIYIQYKLVSLSQRFSAQLEGVRLIKEGYSEFFFGFGSGRTFDMIGKAFHNGFVQFHFAHGFLTLILFSLFFPYIFSRFSSRYTLSSNDSFVIFCGFLVFLAGNLALDTIFTMVFVLFVVLSRVRLAACLIRKPRKLNGM